MVIDESRITKNIEDYKTNNPEKTISNFIMLLHHKCLNIDIFNLYEDRDIKPAVIDFLTLREHIVKAENNEALINLSFSSENAEAKKFLEPLGISIYEAKSIFNKLKEEEFLIVDF